jgi:hypothetical protein
LRREDFAADCIRKLESRRRSFSAFYERYAGSRIARFSGTDSHDEILVAPECTTGDWGLLTSIVDVPRLNDERAVSK